MMADRTDDRSDGEQVVFENDLQFLVRRRMTFDDLEHQLNFAERLAKVLEDRMAKCERVFAKHGWDRSSPKNFPRDAEPFTDLWFAGEIGVKCYMISSRGYEGYHALDVLRMLNMSELWTDWQWYQAFGREARLGKKKRKVGKEWSDARNSPYEIRRAEIVRQIDEYLKRKPDASVTQASRDVADAMGLTAKPNRFVDGTTERKRKVRTPASAVQFASDYTPQGLVTTRAALCVVFPACRAFSNASRIVARPSTR